MNNTLSLEVSKASPEEAAAAIASEVKKRMPGASFRNQNFEMLHRKAEREKQRLLQDNIGLSEKVANLEAQLTEALLAASGASVQVSDPEREGEIGELRCQLAHAETLNSRLKAECDGLAAESEELSAQIEELSLNKRFTSEIRSEDADQIVSWARSEVSKANDDWSRKYNWIQGKHRNLQNSYGSLQAENSRLLKEVSNKISDEEVAKIEADNRLLRDTLKAVYQEIMKNRGVSHQAETSEDTSNDAEKVDVRSAVLRYGKTN